MKGLHLVLPKGRARGAQRPKGDPAESGAGWRRVFREGPDPDSPTSVTQQTQKDKVHLDASGNGVRGAILTF